MRKLKEFVEQMMESHGLNQTAMARKCGIGQATVCNILSGHENVSTGTILKITRAFGFAAQEFIDFPTVNETTAPYMTEKEHRIIHAFRHLDPGRQQMALQIVEDMAQASGPRGTGGGSGTRPDGSVLHQTG